MAAAVLLAATAVAAAACGGSSERDAARGHFAAYRKADDARRESEAALGGAFRDLSAAARAQNRERALAAVGRGQDAATTIDRLLGAEIEEAEALAAYEPTGEHGRRLAEALRRSRDGVRLVAQQLEIATRDPFLDNAANAREVSRLSSRSAELSLPAALARRRAARAIALALGVEPPLDVMFDAPQTTTQG